MSSIVKADQWLWVVVQDPEWNEQFLGQRDESKGISFIPVFLEKDDAVQCLGSVWHGKKERNTKFRLL